MSLLPRTGLYIFQLWLKSVGRHLKKTSQKHWHSLQTGYFAWLSTISIAGCILRFLYPIEYSKLSTSLCDCISSYSHPHCLPLHQWDWGIVLFDCSLVTYTDDKLKYWSLKSLRPHFPLLDWYRERSYNPKHIVLSEYYER